MTVFKQSASIENAPPLENGRKKTKEEKPPTKVVVRRLPPSMTEDQFKMQISPLPDIDYFYFVSADKSLAPNAFSRAYINFVNQSDLFIFTQKFDGYVFIDSKGNEFPAIVEFAPFQRIPKNRPNRKKDSKIGTIEANPVFTAFKERLEAENLENKASASISKQHFFETSLIPDKKESVTTPLLDYIKNRRAERQRIREEKREEKRKKDLERRKAKEEQRRTKKEEDVSVVKVLNSQCGGKERPKDKEKNASVLGKKRLDDVKPAVKEKLMNDSRNKENKPRTGKSYFEERQRQAERREQKKRTGQNSTSISENNPTDIVEDKSLNEDKPIDEKLSSGETKIKDLDLKKNEKPLKKEEIKKTSHKYISNRDKEGEDYRKSRKSKSDRSYQVKRDDDRLEESGRKKYSESRKNNYDSSQRDRYKDKSKSSYLKKYSGSASVFEKSKHLTDNKSSRYNDKNAGKVKSEQINGQSIEEINNLSCSTEDTDKEDEKNILDHVAKSKPFDSNEKTRITRRNSFEYDKNTCSSTSSKVYGKDKYSERKRRNSVGSSKTDQDCAEDTFHKYYKEFLVESKDIGSVTDSMSKNKAGKSESDNNQEHFKEKGFKKGFNNKEEDKATTKRRNSTGERHSPLKMSPRRNSLGSEDNEITSPFQKFNFNDSCPESSKESKRKNESKAHISGGDPRTERRIRNKDRPSIEIYRPGMGKFSKQRMEREKVLGSSTEVESPSSSPSPTPTLKHKSSGAPS